MSIPEPSDIPHIYRTQGFGATIRTFHARPSEMKAWRGRPWWWRATHRSRAPWRTGTTKVTYLK